MTVDEAWEVYDAGAGKRGKPSNQFIKARDFLTQKGLLNLDNEEKKKEEKKEKKPPLELSIIWDAENVPESQQESIYMEGLDYIRDKRNFDFDYYLVGRYGLTRPATMEWEQKSKRIAHLREVATWYMERKHVDAVCDKWSGGNPLGNMLLLKSKFGYDDKAGIGATPLQGTINIVADVSEDDLEDMDY